VRQFKEVARRPARANVRGVFPRVLAGSYYAYGSFCLVTKPVRGSAVFRDLKVDLKPAPKACE